MAKRTTKRPAKSKAARKPAAASPARRLIPPRNSVAVRTYRQGFGDCFLLAFRGGGTAVKYVLIDCGVVLMADEKARRLSEIAQNILDATGNRIDVMVITHEHYDHVSGFMWAQTLFKEMRVKAVWVAWTEDKTDELARQIGDQRDFTISALAMAKPQILDKDAATATSHAMGRLQFFGDPEALASDAMGFTNRPKWSIETDRAMSFAVSKVDRPEYLMPGRVLENPAGIKDLRVYVLGPPHNLARLRDLQPTKGTDDAYLARPRVEAAFFMAGVAAMHRRAAAGGEPDDVPGADVSLFPFPDWLRIPEKRDRPDAGLLHPSHPAHPPHPRTPFDEFLAQVYFGDDSPQSKRALDWRRIDRDWLRFADRLALQLDNMTNNTSLALAFELTGSGRVLLFPGDAQIGNWESWHDEKFHLAPGKQSNLDPDRDGVVVADDILGATVLYKVGHHGSHNGTHRAMGLERMTNPDLVAVVPVDHAHAVKSGWPEIPWAPLMSRLHERTRGRVLITQAGSEPAPSNQPPTGSTPAMWKAFHKRLTVDPKGLHYDLVIKNDS